MIEIQNIEYGIRLLHRLTIGKHLGPLRIDIAPTSRCNFRCEFCNWHSPLIDKVTPAYNIEGAAMLRLVRHLIEMKVKHICLSGNGEPLLNPTTLEVIRIYGSRIDIELVTNGSLLDKVNQSIFDNLDVLTISLNAATPETHQKVHGYKDDKRFGFIIEELNRLMGYADARSKVVLNYAICKDNEADISAFKEICNNRGINYRIRPVSVDRPVFQQLSTLPPEEERKPKLRPCYNAYIQPFITADGKVLLCPGSRNRPMGDLNIDSFNVIWNRSYQLRLWATKLPILGEYCASCKKCPTPDLQSAQFHNLIGKYL